MRSKLVTTAEEAVSSIETGSSIAFGGFGVTGSPVVLMDALNKTEAADLELIANNGAVYEWACFPLLEQGRVRRIIASHIGGNKALEAAYRNGEVEVELVPQGTLVGRLHAASAGQPAFYTKAGVGTWLASGEMPLRYDSDGKVLKWSKPREVREFGGERYLLEEAIIPDYALVHAKYGDAVGNLVFHQSAQNFNPTFAASARCTIAQVEEFVDVGEIDPNQVHLPGVYVDTILEVGREWKWHEILVTSDGNDQVIGRNQGPERNLIAARAAQEFGSGDIVNLGVGIPTMIPAYIPSGIDVMLHSENGILGLTGPPSGEEASTDLTNASKESASVRSGASFLPSAMAFDMIRAGYVDVTVLGAMQVSERGDLANWAVPGRQVSGMGGAMDLVAGSKRVVVTTLHNDRSGRSKIVPVCDFPLTGPGVVDRIITELAVIDVTFDGLVLKEIAANLSVEDVRARTEAELLVPREPTVMGS